MGSTGVIGGEITRGCRLHPISAESAVVVSVEKDEIVRRKENDGRAVLAYLRLTSLASAVMDSVEKDEMD